MYKHLFVPVDGSDLSHRAMDGSIELAKQLGARITGFVVEPDLPLSSVSPQANVSSARIKNHETANQEHAEALLSQFNKRATNAGVVFSGLSVTAYGVDHAIMEGAEKSGCDMIVMVTHGRGSIGQFLFGSHTQKIVAQSKLPVLILH
jgi:nucleotide-binding universal stress UspA family protein